MISRTAILLAVLLGLFPIESYSAVSTICAYGSRPPEVTGATVIHVYDWDPSDVGLWTHGESTTTIPVSPVVLINNPRNATYNLFSQPETHHVHWVEPIPPVSGSYQVIGEDLMKRQWCIFGSCGVNRGN